MQSIAGFAKKLGLEVLAEVFVEAYEPDIRNGYAHADYLLAPDGVWLQNRYGKPYCIPWLEFNYLIEKGINFYATWTEIVHEYIKSYERKKVVQGRLNPKEPLGEWTLHFDIDKKTLTVSGHVLT